MNDIIELTHAYPELAPLCEIKAELRQERRRLYRDWIADAAKYGCDASYPTRRLREMDEGIYTADEKG